MGVNHGGLSDKFHAGFDAHAGAQASVLTIDTNLASSFFPQKVGDIDPTAPCSRRAIHFELYGRILPQPSPPARIIPFINS
jgi:hypothetical protein